MEYLRRYLLLIREIENLDPYRIKLSIGFILSFFSLVFAGVLIDAFLSFNFVTNFIRMFISVLCGLSLFSFTYLKSVEYNKKKLAADSTYLKMRKRFSYRQRVNISIVLFAIAFSYLLLVANQNLMYTANSSIIVYVIIMTLAFARRTRDEFIKDVYEIPDVRDLKTKKEESE